MREGPGHRCWNEGLHRAGKGPRRILREFENFYYHFPPSSQREATCPCSLRRCTKVHLSISMIPPIHCSACVVFPHNTPKGKKKKSSCAHSSTVYPITYFQLCACHAAEAAIPQLRAPPHIVELNTSSSSSHHLVDQPPQKNVLHLNTHMHVCAGEPYTCTHAHTHTHM